MIRIINGALDTVFIEGEESIVLRGVIDPVSLAAIMADQYQREVLSPGKIEALKKALKTSRVPDVDLGMRGESAREVSEDGRLVWILDDDVYVIDGLQRKTAGEQLVIEGIMPHIGALVHFGTTEEWERARFEALNTSQTALNTNIILRNLAEENPAAALMLELTTASKGFVLNDRVSWGQNMRRGDLITAITFYKVLGRLHSHIGPGKSDPKSLAKTGIGKIIANAGKGNFSANCLTFFALVDSCFGLRDVAYRKTATHLKTTFLLSLAGFLSDHEDFWAGNRLTVPADLSRKLASFPVNDPTVRQFASSSGMAVKALEQLIAEHINSGKRTRRLTRRLSADLNDCEVSE